MSEGFIPGGQGEEAEKRDETAVPLFCAVTNAELAPVIEYVTSAPPVAYATPVTMTSDTFNNCEGLSHVALFDGTVA